jgi:hypothetical protein
MTDPTVNGILLSGITALAGVVTYLWRQITSHYAELKDAHQKQYQELKADRDECIKDREELWKALYSIHPAARTIKE